MNCRKGFLSIVATGLLLFAALVVSAQQTNSKATTVITTGAPTAPQAALSVTDLLPDKLAGAKATGEIKQYTAENLAELVAGKAAIYQEYRVKLAASRTYGATRVDVFKTDTPYTAFGLFTYVADLKANKATAKEDNASRSVSADGLVAWKQSYFVKVSNGKQGDASVQASFAAAVTEKIPASEEAFEKPALFDSLPKNSLVAHSEKYLLGAQSLNAYIERASDMFSFDGEAEAVIAEYRQTDEKPNEATKNALSPQSSKQQAAITATASTAKALKLLIVEYHTPQFATDALNRLNGFMTTLSEDERNRFVIKRVGNFIVAATNFEDRDFADSLVNAIEYPYVVKWLQNPAIPTNDPFAVQKAGQLLVSTFNLIGLTGIVVLLCGSILGTTIFLRRRKQQSAVFSDAGGMIGLHIDPVDESLLSLPPASSRDE
jgi:hypothetical protein